MAGEIVAEFCGVPYAEYMQRNFLQPLGLESSSPDIPAEHRGGRFARCTRDLSRVGISERR